MISFENSLFHLKNSALSCLLRISPYGFIEQLHFGAPVSVEDAEALSCKPGLGWGCSIIYDESKPGSCPENYCLAWSGSGRGDYNESPIELNGAATEFRYVSHRILDCQPAAESGLPLSHGECECLELCLEQKGARLFLYFTLYDSALTRRAVLENTGDAPISLYKLMSFSMDLPGEYELINFHGGWIAEMQKQCSAVGGSRVVNESYTGASSNRHNPGFMLAEPEANESSGTVYGFNLVYSGNHYASAQRSLQGITRVMQGISPTNFIKELQSDERFESPEAVLCFSDAGFGGLSEKMHSFVLEHIVPEYWKDRERPVLYNSWEGCMFKFSHSRLVDLGRRAKELGCELFVLDDGWFGKRNNDLAGLGDYDINTKKLPHGMSGLAKSINALGLDFGLWFEPESVNEDSELYRAHPDWALKDDFPLIRGRHQLLLDLSREEVRDYIVDNVCRVLDSSNISYVKWDMNRHSVALGLKAHEYILGLYDVMRRIFEPRPHILLENCSSGGNRFDLGMLCFGPQIWCSDNTDPISRLEIQGNLSYLYPQSCFGAHVSAAPHAQTLRTTPLSTRGNVSFFGCLGYELDLKLLHSIEVQEIKQQIAFYKQYRRLFQFGKFTRIPKGWQVSEGNLHAAGVFHGLMHAAPAYERLRLKGLQPLLRYSLEGRDQKLRIGQFAGLFKHVLPVELKPDGALIRTADKLRGMDDGRESFTAGGAALMSGIMLKPQFRGTGYDLEQHTQGDFGSNVYIVRALEE